MEFNASTYLLDRQITGGRGERLALTGRAGDVTYAELHDLVRRLAGGLRRAGVQPDHRVMMFMADSPWFVAVFLAAMRIGAVPVPVSTMMRPDGLAELLRDSRARFLALTPEFGETVSAACRSAPDLTDVFAPDGTSLAVDVPVRTLEGLAAGEPTDDVYPTV